MKIKQFIDEQFEENPNENPYNKKGLDGRYLEAFKNWLTQKRQEYHAKFWDKDADWSGKMADFKNLPITPQEQFVDELLKELEESLQ